MKIQTLVIYFIQKKLAKRQFKLMIDMQRYKVALRPNKDLIIWKTICEMLNRGYDNNPLKIFEKFNYDA